MTRHLLAMLAVAVLSGSALAQTVRDVPYGEGERNRLDLYLPEGVSAPPLVVFVHGGRWFRNDRTQVALYGRVERLTGAGIAIASIDYTYSTEAPWPAQREDLARAFAFLRENGATYGYDAARIAVWGQSSGAHLALWAAVDPAVAGPEGVDAVVSWYAPSDLFALAADRAADDVPDRPRLDAEPSPEARLIGAPLRENRALADAASPLHALGALAADRALPPALLVHGTADAIVSPRQTERLHAAMQARPGARVTLRRVEGAGHGGEGFDAEVPPAVAFLEAAFEDAD
ncbi:MAG: alpha/beta hydrolase [Pseudomonadota bacterium]